MPDPNADPQNTGSHVCAACGSDNVATARFCAACGAMLPSRQSSSTASGAASLLQDARHHLNAAEWEEAALAAEAVLAFDPGSAEAHNIIARARLKQGMRNAALVHAERAAELDPKNPAYQADIALARGDGRGRNLAPAIAASAVAVIIFASLLAVATSRPRNALPPPDAGDYQASGGMAPAPSMGGYPQTLPSPSGSAQPKMPPAPSVTSNPPSPRSGPVSEEDAVPPPTPASGSGQPFVTGLEPAPVDQALRPFPAPATPPTKPPSEPAPRPVPSTRRETSAVPTPQPGGTVFGPGAAAPPVTTVTPPGVRQSPYVLTEPPSPAFAEPGTEPERPAPPQQYFIDRNYPEAVRGYVRMVQENPDNAVAWQQLGAAYAQLGMRTEAVDAYRQAIDAYGRQMAAGTNVELAQRGIRTCQRALQMLAVR